MAKESSNSTTTGRTFAANPMSASRISPCRGFTAIEDVQYFLLDLTIRQHVAPLGLLPLLDEEPQEMQHFLLHRFRLAIDFLNQ